MSDSRPRVAEHRVVAMVGVKPCLKAGSGFAPFAVLEIAGIHGLLQISVKRKKLSLTWLLFREPLDDDLGRGGPIGWGSLAWPECHFGRRVVGPLVGTCRVVFDVRRSGQLG